MRRQWRAEWLQVRSVLALYCEPLQPTGLGYHATRRAIWFPVSPPHTMRPSWARLSRPRRWYIIPASTASAVSTTAQSSKRPNSTRTEMK